MSETATEIEARSTADPRAGVIRVAGDVTSASEVALMDAYGRVVGGGGRLIILDFSDLAYMNSGGIGLLVTLLVRVQRQGLRLRAIGLNDHYRQIFTLTRLDEAIGIFDSEAAALAG
jgi:anti-sigma B factor antagonist